MKIRWYIKLRMAYKILLPVGIVLLLVLAVLEWQIEKKGAEIVQTVAEREFVALGGMYSAEVRRNIEEALNETITIANLVAEFERDEIPLSRQQILRMLVNVDNKAVTGIGVVFYPSPDDAQYVNTPGSDENGQFYPFITDDGMRLMNKKYFDADFVAIPTKTKKPYISDPYAYKADSGKTILMVGLSAPVIVDNEVRGIIFFDYALDILTTMTKDIQLYQTGGIAVLTQSGTIMAHRNPELVLKNFLELERWRNDTVLKDALGAGDSYLTVANAANAVSDFVYFHPFTFPQTGQTMYFLVVTPASEVLAEVLELTHVTLLASAFAFIILLIVIFLGVRSSIKPLTLIVSAAEDVTHGNFDVKLDSKDFGGEILDLKLALDAMIGSLVENIGKAKTLSKDAQEQTAKAQEAMREADGARVAAEGAKREGMLAAARQLETVVEVISTASQELSVQVEKSERASSEQAIRMSETAVAMEEMNSTVLEVARNAGSASEISAQTRSQAETGARIVQEAVTGIQRVQSVSLALKEDMGTLAEQAKAISEIMNVISDIADQTNLLALNAAIEAARAGDAGRGFAVVADEVRKLAEKTMSSTTDVGNAIQSIQASVDASIRQVDQAVNLIGTATEQSNQSGIALNEIVGLVDSTADQVHAIATASEEQSATSEEINRAISEINEISEESAQAMARAASSVNDLAAQTQTLSQLIDEMKQG